MDALLHDIAVDVATCESIERNLKGKTAAAKITLRKDAPTRDMKEVVQVCVEACRESRKRYHEENGPGPDLSDEALSQYTRFTDHNALHVYRHFLWYAPRLVNVVTAKYRSAHEPSLHCSCTHMHTHLQFNRIHLRAPSDLASG